MKKAFFIIILLLSIHSIGQKKYGYKRGIKFISKAEMYYKKNDYQNSLYFINKYENSVLGYCGSAFIMAEKTIADLKVKNYIGLKKFDDALGILAEKEPLFFEDFQKDDSLKVEILFLKFGKGKVMESFRNIEKLEHKSIDLTYFIYSVYLKEIDCHFKFRKPRNKTNNEEYENEELKPIELLDNTLVYKLIFSEN